MSGETALKVEKVEELKNAIDKKLEEYRKVKGLNFSYNNESLQKALNLSRLEVETLPYDVLCGYAYVLNGYAAFLQNELNSVSSDLKWINHHITILMGKYGSGFGDSYTNYEFRKSMLLTQNSYGIELNKLLLEASLRFEQLNMMSSKINTIANTLLAKGRKYEKSS